MSLLLEIPLEIRHEIFRWVICTLSEPPISPGVEQDNRRPLPYGNYLRNGTWNAGDFLSRGVWYCPPTNLALSLLQVNKQINAEVTSFFQSLPNNYYVDVMYVKESGVWPTWWLPALPRTPYIDSVHATFRIFNPPYTLQNRFQYKIKYSRGYASSYSIYSCLYGLLAALFNRGPGLIDRSHPEDDDSIAPKYVIKNILIDVVAPNDGSGHKSIFVDDDRYKFALARRGLAHYAGHDDTSLAPEERLAEHMVKYLALLLACEVFMPNTAMIVYEQMIGAFVFTVNGREFKRIDVETSLQKWEANYLGPGVELHVERRQRLQEWKDWVDERRWRMKKGLELDNTRPVPRLWDR